MFSHREGAFHITCNVADAALGLRVVAEVFDGGGVGMVGSCSNQKELVQAAGEMTTLCGLGLSMSR